VKRRVERYVKVKPPFLRDGGKLANDLKGPILAARRISPTIQRKLAPCSVEKRWAWPLWWMICRIHHRDYPGHCQDTENLPTHNNLVAAAKAKAKK
jgi:hypothetical protein